MEPDDEEIIGEAPQDDLIDPDEDQNTDTDTESDDDDVADGSIEEDD